MKTLILLISFMAISGLKAESASANVVANLGPAAALRFAMSYRGDVCKPGELYCYPDAIGIPFSDTKHILSMNSSLWKPAEIVADYHKRMDELDATQRKKGIIVLLKTERCATKAMRACSVTTAALDRESTPLADEFLIYGIQIKPRDGDNPPGTLKIEKGGDAWKNDAAGEYRFEQGPGATLVFLDPTTGEKIVTTNALKLRLVEKTFIANQGRTPELEQMLKTVLQKLNNHA